MSYLTMGQNIAAITCQEDYLSVNFNNAWYQENIDELIELVFISIPNAVIQEKIMGADRENIRFSWDNHYFVLNFEYYSQSCWIEGQDNDSREWLTTLLLAITAKS